MERNFSGDIAWGDTVLGGGTKEVDAKAIERDQDYIN
jgi:hypothetical protein